jgi:hypothetical protein
MFNENMAKLTLFWAKVFFATFILYVLQIEVVIRIYVVDVVQLPFLAPNVDPTFNIFTNIYG